MIKKILLTILIATLLLSCTVTETIDITQKESGSSILDVSVEDFFIEVLEDYSEFAPESDLSMMDNAIFSFSDLLNETSNTSSVRFVKTSNNSYTGYFDFNSIEQLCNELAKVDSQTILNQTNNSFSLYIDIDNYEELEQIVPLLKDPNIEVYLAKYNIGYSEADYLDMMIFSLGEEAPDAITNSVITINGSVPGTITSIKGGEKTSSNTFSFSFNLIDFLLLIEPIEFSLTYK